ncbi:hypothetical protein D3C75_813430 [compost metagenome]
MSACLRHVQNLRLAAVPQAVPNRLPELVPAPGPRHPAAEHRQHGVPLHAELPRPDECAQVRDGALEENRG